MTAPARPKRTGILLLILKFVISAPIITMLWWECLPYYGALLGKVCGFIAWAFLSVPIDGSSVTPRGWFNVESLLNFQVGEHQPAMPIAVLVTNVAPYIALIISTSGLTLRRRLRILGIGISILVAGHIAFICILLGFQEQLIKVRELPTAVTQFYLTLPFLLWIVLAYWEHILSYIGENGKRK
ncbi:MAG: hypothetical protein GC168_00415 [Candidatus Hydrogenedens sp.]|nr:hypothetical protein [Candidatus Hydrogenedens sp.]